MDTVKKTLKERRSESDERIIRSAIKNFGEKGYTYSSLKDIAKDAGITAGLITQRYDSKDKLLEMAYKEAVSNIFREADENDSPRECLNSKIEDIEALYDRDRDVFEFIKMIHNASDIPMGVLEKYRDELKREAAYDILLEAQKQGMLPEGSLDMLLASLNATVLNQVSLCKRYNIELPKAELFLQSIRFSDSITRNHEKWYQIINRAIENTFEMLVYVNIPKNTGEMLRSSEKFKFTEKYIDIRAEIARVIPLITTEGERKILEAYLNIDTLSERMKGKKSLSMKFPYKNGSYFVHTFLPIEWDSEGNLTEVFAGIYEVKPN